MMPFPGDVSPTRSVWGLDLSLTSTGRSLIWLPHQAEDPAVYGRSPDWRDLRVHMDHVTSSGHDGDPWSRRFERWDDLLCDVMHDIQARSIVYVEGPALGMHTKSSWDRACFWGMVMHQLRLRNCAITVVAPNLRLKYATGKGSGEKTHVVAALVKRYPHVLFTGNDDEADAFVLAAMASRMCLFPVEPTPLPQANMDALRTLAEPAAER